ncbi:lambda-exonuclease family protein [Galenea microaerophila]
MSMQVLNVLQGTEEWLEVRKNYFTASEAPAMMGVSKYMTREKLLKAKKFGDEEVSSYTKKLFEKGHAAEETARPIAEQIIGETLYPITGTKEVDGLKLLASFDGINLTADTIWEHKLFNQELAEQIKNGEIHPQYKIQIAHQFLVSGAKKCLFMASDGTKENIAYAWLEADELMTEDVVNSLINGWKKFQKDLEAYEMPKEVPAESWLEEKFTIWQQLKSQKEAIEEQLKTIEQEMKNYAQSHHAECVKGQNFKISLVRRKGAIDYKKIPILKDIDLEKYRKKDSEFYTIKPL